jgi:hypothetical protein
MTEVIDNVEYITLGPVDLNLLSDQLELLVSKIGNDGDSILWGLVEMLEDILPYNQE